jgi:hypothetical protein
MNEQQEALRQELDELRTESDALKVEERHARAQVNLSFDLINGAFLPGLMPRLGLRGASRWFLSFSLCHIKCRIVEAHLFRLLKLQMERPNLPHKMAHIHQKPLQEALGQI